MEEATPNKEEPKEKTVLSTLDSQWDTKPKSIGLQPFDLLKDRKELYVVLYDNFAAKGEYRPMEQFNECMEEYGGKKGREYLKNYLLWHSNGSMTEEEADEKVNGFEKNIYGK